MVRKIFFVAACLTSTVAFAAPARSFPTMPSGDNSDVS